MTDPLEAETTELLQALIRNACVNDGAVESGEEERNAATIAAYLDGCGLDLETYAPAPGRTSLVARIDGAPGPTLLLLGHTDVVPVNPDRWQRDPFGGELVDGEVWGRGAVDMLNLTASMAVAVRHLAEQGLVYAAVADEEALGTHGANWLVAHEREAVAADYVLTESGGIPVPTPSGIRLPVVVGEKGTRWCRLRVRGTSGHASQPLRTDNALVKAAEVVRRIAALRPAASIHDVWRRFVEALDLGPELTAALTDPSRVLEACEALPQLGFARQAHASTHPTFAPTVVHGGTKTNVIPDVVDLELDVRTLPGQTAEQVDALLWEALGDLAGDVEVLDAVDDPASASATDTPLWDALERATAALWPGARTVPMLTVGATDARFFRRAGAVAYGFGLFSRNLSFEQYSRMFHGDDERVDTESLRLSTELWQAVSRELLARR
jgi:acetylornithine deacetylase/succinyl-diaminopimelate desuccinylase-like protein